MTTFPQDAHGLIHRSAVIKAGLTDDDLRRSLRRHEIVRVIRGVFAVAAIRDHTTCHRLQSIATATTNSRKHPLSHQSAAVMHGLEMLKPNFRRVHTTAPDSGYRTATAHCHVATLDDDDVVEVDGIAVTSIERTAVDIACATATFPQALAVFDSALRLGAKREVMAEMLIEKRRGVAVARRALHFADGSSENPGESWSRAQMIEAGLRLPRLQHTFRDGDQHVARTDFDWDGRLVGEFDGKVKYQKLLKPGEDVTEVVLREKAREDKLRSMNIMVIRWTWADLEAGRVVELIRQWLVQLEMAAA
ncbi:hypothetical protein ABLE94_16210 [Gordonia sp. VNK1]|uniref:hypothetical protein n=1 Tax=Gordonia oleivorans TaxID=3156618 RepID=UPI0032B3929A